jgi:hypothetical protein
MADMIVQFRDYCRAFQRIEDQGENYEQEEALELISEMLNNNHNTERTTFQMCAALARSARTGEIDDDAQQEWDDTQEYLDGLNDNA